MNTISKSAITAGFAACLAAALTAGLTAMADVPRPAPPSGASPIAAPAIAPACVRDNDCTGGMKCDVRAHACVLLTTTDITGSCSNAMETVTICDSLGRCHKAFSVSCYPNGCDAQAIGCGSSCSRDADCAHGAECFKSSCRPHIPHVVGSQPPIACTANVGSANPRHGVVCDDPLICEEGQCNPVW